MNKKGNRICTQNKKYKKNFKKSKKTKLFRKTQKLRGGTVKKNSNENYFNNLMNESFSTIVNDKEYTFEIVNENGEVFQLTGIYSGMWQNNEPVSEGIMNFENSKFECQWKDGLPNGKGIISWSNGNRYEGDLLNGNIVGKGIKYFNDGDIFQGTWKYDRLNGKDCIMIQENGTYKGECRDNMREGYGIFEKEGIFVYNGHWLDNMRNGYGIFEENGTVYKGQWLDNMRQGYGRFEKEENVYDGNWENDVPNGHGTMTYANGNIYDGNWLNDKPNGNGTFKFLKTGVIIEGIFIICYLDNQERLCAKGTAHYPDGSKFIGEFVNNEKVSGYAVPRDRDNLANNDTYDIEYGFLADPQSITNSPFL